MSAESKIFADIEESLVREEGVMDLALPALVAAESAVNYLRKFFKDKMPHLQVFKRDTVERMVSAAVGAVIGDPANEDTFMLAIRVIKIILQVQPIEDMTQASLLQSVSVASFPWLAGMVKPADLRISETLGHNLASAASKLLAGNKNHVPRWATSGLPLLANMQKDVGQRWRLQVLRRAFAEGDATMRQRMVNDLPVWLTCFGPSATTIIKEIVKEILSKEADPGVLEALGGIGGRLLCAQARDLVVKRHGEVFIMKCHICDSKKGEVEKKTTVVLKMNEVEHLLGLVGATVPKARRKALSLVPALANHVGFSAQAARLFTNYLQDNDKMCVDKFSRQIHYLLKSTAGIDVTDNGDRTAAAVITAVDEIVDAAAGEAYVDEFNTAVVCRLVRCLARSTHAKVADKVMLRALDLVMSKKTFTQAFYFFCSLMKEQRPESREKLMESVAQALCGQKGNLKIEFLAATFCTKPANFLHAHLRHLLPLIIMALAKNKFKGPDPVAFIAKRLDVKPRTLLAQNFKHIFPAVVMGMDSVEFESCIKYLEGQTLLTLEELISTERHNIITELFFKFYRSPRKARHAISYVAIRDPAFNGKDRSSAHIVSNLTLLATSHS